MEQLGGTVICYVQVQSLEMAGSKFCAANVFLWFSWDKWFSVLWCGSRSLICRITVQQTNACGETCCVMWAVDSDGNALRWLAAVFSSVSCRQGCLCLMLLLCIRTVKSGMGALEGINRGGALRRGQHILPLEAWVYTGCLTQYRLSLHTYGVTTVRWITGAVLQCCSFHVILKLLLQLLVGILLALGSLECASGDCSPHYGYA